MFRFLSQRDGRCGSDLTGRDGKTGGRGGGSAEGGGVGGVFVCFATDCGCLVAGRVTVCVR